MTLLLSPQRLAERRLVATHELRPLAESLAADLEPLVGRDPFVPLHKARLTRHGGRCAVDGTLLEFDPFSPSRHRCASCGRVYEGEDHDRWWVMGYQLWLAERSVHAALLHVLRGEERHARLASDILERYAEVYKTYPNADNALGPTRPFFSTYLESIWLLQLAVALDLLEAGGGAAGSLGGRVRSEIIAPSAELIASYDEGGSNRQVWNDAARIAAGRLLQRERDVDAALFGRSGVVSQLQHGLLHDGTWYEGENYHLFAHRGLWYSVAMAEAAGATLPAGLVSRYEEAFATPFLTALPDFTLPSRRDSPYAVTLRQWRFAELAELGLARRADDLRLRGALHELYGSSIPRRDTGRSRSPAEAERNAAPTSLSRADLGWRSLLHARATLPPLEERSPGSVILEGQGYAVLRREEGATHVALDFGHSGAGHGHPDRLNLTLARGDVRWLDDVGTGSYVDPSLHWYRSTLAHNAPLIDGRSQRRVHGTLVSFHDRGDFGLVTARADDIAPDVRVERSIMVAPSYLIDELTWSAPRAVTLDLPIHTDGTVHGVGEWRPASVDGGREQEDGFTYLEQCEVAPASAESRLTAVGPRGERAEAWVLAAPAVEWWRANAPGPPGQARRRFHAVRNHTPAGTLHSVWSWAGAVVAARRVGSSIVVELSDGARHTHRRGPDGWQVERDSAHERTTIVLSPDHQRAGTASQLERQAPPAKSAKIFVVPRQPGDALHFTMGERHYRRTEESWREAGAPTSRVALFAAQDGLHVVVDVVKHEVSFAEPRDENPLDNEHPDINSDGVQLHLMLPAETGGNASRLYRWLLVPERDRVRVTPRLHGGGRVDVEASWSLTADGYRVHAIVRGERGVTALAEFALDVLVNEMPSTRERRRGQLVMSGTGPDEFLYLAGDRHDSERFLRFRVSDE